MQRTRRFLPAHFSASPASSNRRYVDKQDIHLPPFRTWWLNIPSWIVGLFECLVRGLLSISRTLGHVGLRLHSGAAGHNSFAGTLLRSWGGLTYCLFMPIQNPTSLIRVYQHRSSRIYAWSQQLTFNPCQLVLLRHRSSQLTKRSNSIHICRFGTCGSQRPLGPRRSGTKAVSRDYSGRSQITWLLSSGERIPF